MGRFKNGLFFGSLFGASLMWMSVTKEGKKTRQQLLNQAAEIYKDVKKTVLASPEWRKLSKEKYVRVVRAAVERYGKEFELSADAKKMLVKIVTGQWSRLGKE